MPNKILVISNAYPSADHPSYGVFVRRCVEALQASGHHVVVVGLGQSALLRRLLAYLAFAARANGALLRDDYHCVYIHYPLHSLLAALPALVLRRHRLVLNFHGHDLMPITFRGRVLKSLVSPFFQGRATVLVPSGRFKRLFDTQYPARRGGTAIVCRSGGVAPAYLEAKAPALQDRGRSALFLSRWVEGKGWPAYLSLARALLDRFPDFRFTIAGSGPDETRIRRAIVEHGLEHAMAVTPAVTEQTNVALYHAHRYFIFPSQLEESLGLVNLEAMACGCIVLSSAFEAAHDYLEHGLNGHLLSHDGFAELALEAVAALEADTARAQEIAQRGRAVAQRMSQAMASAELSSALDLH